MSRLEKEIACDAIDTKLVQDVVKNNEGAFLELEARIGRKSGAIPSALLARHVLAITHGLDWPVRCAALDAIFLRAKSAAEEKLLIVARPTDGKINGYYETRAEGQDTGAIKTPFKTPVKTPVKTLLRSLDPLDASCNCEDYLRNSLKLCKHIWAAAQDAFLKKAKSKALIAEQMLIDESVNGVLEWDPVRPPCGLGDRLEQLTWRICSKRKNQTVGIKRAINDWFAPTENGGFKVKSSVLKCSTARLLLVNALQWHIARGMILEVDPALEGFLADETVRLVNIQKLERVGTPKDFNTLKQKLYPYQVEGVTRFLASGRLLLADDMGLGKTAQGIACCHILWHTRLVNRGLLIVPSPLKHQWLYEWNNFTDIPVALIEGGPDKRAEQYLSCDSGFLITNYEQLRRDISIFKNWKPEFVLLDEGQRIKNNSTKTAACVKSLTPPFRLVLTGTPMENRLEELASLMDWIDDYALEPKWRLVPWHTQYSDGEREICGARNLETLRQRIAHCTIRRVRNDVLRELPPRTDIIVPVPMTDAQLALHKPYSKPIATLSEIRKKRPLTPDEFLRLMQIFQSQRLIANGVEVFQFKSRWEELKQNKLPGEKILRLLDSPKLLAFRELVKSVVIEHNRKVIVFSQWTRMLKLCHWAIGRLLKQHRIRAVSFTGEERPKRRTHNMIDLRDDPDCRIMFLSDAGGVGLNLQHAATCCINLDLPWNPAVLEQRIGRIYRLGQKHPVDIYNLISIGGIEERIANLISNKQALFAGLFEGVDDEILYDDQGGMLQHLDDFFDQTDISDEAIEGPAGELTNRKVAIHSGNNESVTIANVSLATTRRTPWSLPASAVADVFQSVTFQSAQDGSVTLTAPPHSAEAFLSAFERMAALFRTT